jgi:RNA polymerase-binding transcription factor DksA
MPVVLTCGKCGTQSRLTDQQMVEELQSRGMLRRDAKPSTDLVRELFNSLTDQRVCPDCNCEGMQVGDDWEDEWTDGVLCAACQTRIPPERLEVFPHAKFCPACQAQRDAGEEPGAELEYCERCGGILKLANRGGTGLAGYRMVCSDCGR